MNIDDLIPPDVVATVAAQGLHKVAGAMLGVPELTVKEAVTQLGTKAFMRRKEARAVVDGIAAFGVLTNEKVAESPALMALLQRAAMPALAGAGVAAIPQLLSDDPMQQHRSLLPTMGIGALLGGAGGALHSMHSLPPEASQGVAQALRSLP